MQERSKQYSYLLFDIDNTLMDFNAGERAALFQTMEEAGVLLSEADFRRYREINRVMWTKFEKGLLDSAAVQRVRFEEFAVHLGRNAAEGPALNEQYVSNLARQAIVMDGALDMLKRLHADYRIVAVTNGLHLVQRPRLERSGLLPYLDAAFVSQEMGVQKPDKAYFDRVLEELGEQDRGKYLVIGDSLSADIQGGINAGIDTCWLRPAGAAPSETIKPTYIVGGYGQLMALLGAAD